MKSKTVRAWHFVGDTLRDGSPIPADGVWLEYKGALKMCESGLHASRHPFDAMKYAPGNTLCIVECSGEIIEDTDKLVCSRRRIIERMDATEMLRYFARMQALSVVHLWDAPDVVLDYLMTGEEELRAAALDAALDAAWAAARAERAARDAAWAAWDAAWAAERAAERAAWAAERAARKDFAELVNECFYDYL